MRFTTAMSNDEFFNTAVIMRGRVFHPIDGCVEHRCDDDLIRVNFTLDPMSSKKFETDKTCTIKNVIFNDPATIVFWTDGTKTVVKCSDMDEFDPEKGIAMALAKKVLGANGSYYNKIKKWTEKYYEEERKKALKSVDEMYAFYNDAIWRVFRLGLSDKNERCFS